MPRMAPRRGTKKIWKKEERSCRPRMWMAGMVKTEPPATIPEVAPMARTFTFSSRLEARPFSTLTARVEKPTARIEMGMADSMPCPSFRAM